MSARVRGLVLAAAAVALAVALAWLWLVGPAGRDLMWRVTGEEDAWEGAKGLVAAAIIERTGPELRLEPDAPVADLGLGPRGVNTFLQLEADPEVVRLSAAAMRAAGIGWVRQQFPWEDIEIHGRGDFEDRRNDPPRSAWDKYDRLVETLARHDIRLLVRLDDPPDWAYPETERDAAGGVAHKGPPGDFGDFARFAAAVAGRYCGRIRYYQIWNEPNIYPEWGERDVDPAGYAALLAAAAAAVREACPDARIVSAAMAQTTETGGRNMDDLLYLEALYAAGWQGSFDVLGAQAFGLWTGPTDRRVSRDRANFARVQIARDVMVRHGDAAKAVWITEFGWDSPPPAMAAPYGRVSETSRARYTLAAYERIAGEWPWVGNAFLWFLRRPNWEWHQRPEGYFRLLDPDWTHTTTYDALVASRDRPSVLGRGRHGHWHAALGYTGPWRREGMVGSGTEAVEGAAAPAEALEGAAAPTEALIGAAAPTEAAGGAAAPTEAVEGAAAGPGPAGPDATTGVVTGTAGAEVQIRFRGTRARALLSPTVRRPTVYSVLDGRTASVQLPTADGDWVVDTGAIVPPTGVRALLQRDVLDLAVDPGHVDEHLWLLRVDGGEMALRAVVVDAPEPASPLLVFGRRLAVAAAIVVAALLVAALMAFVVVLRRRRRRVNGDDGADGRTFDGGDERAVDGRSGSPRTADETPTA